LSEHPGGELAILTFAGKDATEEFNMIHPPDVIGKYAPDAIVGMIGSGGGGGGGAVAVAGPGGAPGITLEEVAKHNTKEDCWVVVSDQVLNVTNFLKDHPGGELAIITFAGKDATEEFNMIHPPDVIGKYAPDAIIGVVGTAAAVAAATAAPATGKQDDNRRMASFNKRMAGEGRIHGWIGAIAYMALGFMKEIIFTIFGQKNIMLSNDRVGLTRSAMFLFVFIIIHAVGNLHVFLGPDDFNGYGYFYVRLYWTGFGLPANIVEEYVLLAAMLHIFVGLKRTADISINMTMSSGKLNLAFSGLALLTFMSIHLFQFRFGETQDYMIRPPPYLINFKQALTLNLFWDSDADVPAVPVRNIYKLEFDVFKSMGWCLFYLSAVMVFTTHMCLGWVKCVGAPALEIPQRHQRKASHVGMVITAFIAMIYATFPIYCHSFKMAGGCLGNQHDGPADMSAIKSKLFPGGGCLLW
jgi:cytochrome b involved in lipid metabolism